MMPQYCFKILSKFQLQLLFLGRCVIKKLNSFNLKDSFHWIM